MSIDDKMQTFHIIIRETRVRRFARTIQAPTLQAVHDQINDDEYDLFFAEGDIEWLDPDGGLEEFSLEVLAIEPVMVQS